MPENVYLAKLVDVQSGEAASVKDIVSGEHFIKTSVDDLYPVVYNPITEAFGYYDDEGLFVSLG